MAKGSRGRPSKYSLEIATTICQHIALGKSLRSICQQDEMPPISTVMDWLIKHKDFSEQYACAREAQADALFDDCIDIADTATPEEVQQARLRIDTRKWMAGKLKPKKYSDKLTLAGDAENPVVTANVDVTAAQRAAIEKQLDAKYGFKPE